MDIYCNKNPYPTTQRKNGKEYEWKQNRFDELKKILLKRNRCHQINYLLL